jgi:hypothetical protein
MLMRVCWVANGWHGEYSVTIGNAQASHSISAWMFRFENVKLVEDFQLEN